MTTIVTGSEVITSITVFTVEPEQQQQLVELLIRAGKEVIRKQPGFVSINIHRSLDQTQVVSYSQWQNRDAFNEMLQHTTMIPYLTEILKIAAIEPHLYEVVAIIRADSATDQSKVLKKSARKGSKK
jgi:quinol monooxygenase YgiN